MTPKEKALDLVYELRVEIEQELSNGENEVSIFFAAKKCALRAVDEICEAIYWHEFESPNKEFEYWQEVKQEINNLK